MVKANSRATLIEKKAFPTLVIARILLVCGLVLLELIAPIDVSTTRILVLRTVMQLLVKTATTDKVTESNKIISSELITSKRNKNMLRNWKAAIKAKTMRNIFTAPRPLGFGLTTS